MASGPAPRNDLELVAALRAGDEAAFMMLVEQLQPAMLRIARMYVPSRAVAEEVVQDAWLGVLKGLDGFEGRSSLRTWIFRILVNIAKTRGQREARSVPFASVWSPGDDEPSVDPDRFQPAGAGAPGHWAGTARRLGAGGARSSRARRSRRSRRRSTRCRRTSER